MDRLESMSLLVAAFEAGSLSAAARRLGLPLATVSRKVSELESHLGVQLFHRSARRLTPSDAGSAYMAACKRILDEIEEAERAATGEYRAPKGDLTLNAPIVLGRIHLVPIVTDFLRAFPDIDVRVVLSDRINPLPDETADAAVRIGELPDSSMRAMRVGTLQRVVCGSPQYFAERGVPMRPLDLRGHDCVTFEAVASHREWTFGGPKKSTCVGVRSRLIVNTAEAALDAVTAGLGITRVLSYQTAAAERAGALVRVLRPFEPEPIPVNLVYPGSSLIPLKIRAFLDFCAPRLRARLRAHAS